MVGEINELDFITEKLLVLIQVFVLAVPCKLDCWLVIMGQEKASSYGVAHASFGAANL